MAAMAGMKRARDISSITQAEAPGTPSTVRIQLVSNDHLVNFLRRTVTDAVLGDAARDTLPKRCM